MKWEQELRTSYSVVNYVFYRFCRCNISGSSIVIVELAAVAFMFVKAKKLFFCFIHYFFCNSSVVIIIQYFSRSSRLL